MWRDDFPKSTNPFALIWFASRPHWVAMTIAITAVTIANILFSSVAYIFKIIVNAAAVLPQGNSYHTLLWAAALYIGISFAGEISTRLSGYASGRWMMGARATARHALTAYVTLHSRSYFSDRFAGSLTNKIGHASNDLREIIDQMLYQFLELIVSVAASFFIAFFVSPVIALIFFGWVVAVFAFNLYFVRRRIPLSKRAQEIETTLTGMTVDLFTNITAMQEYARRFFEIERLKEVIIDRRIAGLRTWNYGTTVRVFNSIFQTVFGGGMVFTAIYLAHIGTLSPGDIILVLSIIFRVQTQLLALGGNLNKFGEAYGEIEESLEEIIEPHEIPDPTGAQPLVVSRGDLSFHAITFSYEESAIFKDLTLNIPSGQRVGLVGRSGAGKSTLMRLILHHHNLDAGKITIDGIDIAAVTQESLRNAISVVPQEPLLFHRSVRENIHYGNPAASFDDIVGAAKLAHAHDFIERLSGGYEAVVGERGIKLSGGERQRVAIARAILKNAPILLLDEATSALDSESEVAIQKALRELMHGKTVIAIAHRLSTLREMDRILVLDRGAVVEEGTHAELVARGGAYAELWHHQAGGFVQDQ